MPFSASSALARAASVASATLLATSPIATVTCSTAADVDAAASLTATASCATPALAAATERDCIPVSRAACCTLIRIACRLAIIAL